MWLLRRKADFLKVAQINEMLSQLDTERVGSEQARRERLRMQIGLKATPA